MNSTPKNVLWTSGWDSTFRIASLISDKNQTVQPFYVLHSSRRSSKIEMKTMQDIRTALIKKDPSIKDRLLETIIIRVEDVPENPEIAARFEKLRDQSFLGSQYIWLSTIAQWKGIKLELSIHRDDTAHKFLESAVAPTEEGIYELRDNVEDSLKVFEPFSFPIFDISKTQMQAIAEDKGFADIMEMTWFCHNPLLDGSPCGICNPCRYTIEEGLGRRIPSPTFSRLAQAKILNFLWRIRNGSYRVGRLIKKQTQR